MNILIVDDEAPNRAGISHLVSRYCPDCRVVAEAGSAETARRELIQHKIEIILLDIHMPNENGFDFLQSLGDHNFQVIFITAHAEYAIRAFRSNAVDYILKPVDAEELKEAIERCRQRIQVVSEPGQHDVYLDSLRQVSGDINSKSFSSLLTLPYKQGFRIVAASQIVYLEASGNYTILYLEGKEQLVITRSLGDFESILDPAVFFRTHKSTLINLDCLAEYSNTDGHFALMKTGEKVLISRRRLDEFVAAIDKRSRRI